MTNDAVDWRIGPWWSMWVGALVLGCAPRTAAVPDKPAPVTSRQTEAAVVAPAPKYTLPTNYADGVRRVRELRDTLRAGWNADDHERVHEPLHELAPLLRELPRLLDKEELPSEDRRDAQLAIHELFDLFSRVDSKLHSGFGASYSDVAPTIDQAIERLQPKAGPRSQ